MRVIRIAVPAIALAAACGTDDAAPAGDAKGAAAPPAASAAPAPAADAGQAAPAAQAPSPTQPGQTAQTAPAAPAARTDSPAAASSSNQARFANAPGPIVLPSGRRVNVQAVAPIRFTQGPPALIVRYGTTLNLGGDTVPLRAEAAEVFERYRAVAERARLNGFVASAVQEPSRGPQQDTSGYNFVWTRSPDGRWHRP